MRISVVILNYNVRSFLELCLYSVQRALRDFEAEIIVVDNASTDQSVSHNRALFPQVTWVANSDNVGFPKGNNQGVALAQGEWLCILNPDTVVPENLFSGLLSRSEQLYQSIASVRLTDGTGAFLPESKRGMPSPWHAFCKMSGLHQLAPRSPWLNGYYAPQLAAESEGRAPILVGALMWMRRSWYEALGGFDEACFMYADDIDLSYRSELQGAGNWYFGGLQTLHFKGESTLRDRVYRQRFAEAMRYFYNKHYKAWPGLGRLIAWGSLGFAFMKQQQTPDPPAEVTTYYWVSTQLQEAVVLERMLKKNCVPLPPQEGKIVISQSFSSAASNAFIWDVATLSIQEVLHFMYIHRDRGWRYFFKLPFTPELLGSHSSVGRGESISLIPKIGSIAP